MTIFADPSTFPSAFDTLVEPDPVDTTGTENTAGTENTSGTENVINTVGAIDANGSNGTGDGNTDAVTGEVADATFAELGLPQPLVRALGRLGIDRLAPADGAAGRAGSDVVTVPVRGGHLVVQGGAATPFLGRDEVVIHHCPSGYPARLESINLRIIPTLKTMFDLPIAYSDHTPGWDMDIAAIALGANMVEKTITHDRTTRSVEHMFSLEPADMAAFVRAVRELETALGDTRKRLSEKELANRTAIRRSAHARRAVRAGDVFDMESIEFRRPGHGIAPDVVEQYLGMRYARDIGAGQIIHPADLTGKA